MTALRVLIVEDHADTASTLAMWVKLAGHAVHTARTGFQGLQAASLVQPDLILLDIGLPDMDGWELAKELRKAPSLAACKIIAVTAYQSAEDRRKSKEAGVDFHLGKPARQQEITAMLSQYAGG